MARLQHTLVQCKAAGNSRACTRQKNCKHTLKTQWTQPLLVPSPTMTVPAAKPPRTFQTHTEQPTDRDTATSHQISSSPPGCQRRAPHSSLLTPRRCPVRSRSDTLRGACLQATNMPKAQNRLGLGFRILGFSGSRCTQPLLKSLYPHISKRWPAASPVIA